MIRTSLEVSNNKDLSKYDYIIDSYDNHDPFKLDNQEVYIYFHNQDGWGELEKLIDKSIKVRSFATYEGKPCDFRIIGPQFKTKNNILKEYSSNLEVMVIDNKVYCASLMWYDFERQYEDSWIYKFTQISILGSIAENAEAIGLKVLYSKDDPLIDSSLYLSYSEECNDQTFEDICTRYNEKIELALTIGLRFLNNIIWKENYHIKETQFMNEFLKPLFRRLGYIRVFHTHGTNEHGKDFVVTEINKLQHIIHTSVQAKRGDLTSKKMSIINTLIEQCKSSFLIPHRVNGSDEQIFISNYVVAVSGKISPQARREFLARVPAEYRHSVHLIDKDELLRLYDSTL